MREKPGNPSSTREANTARDAIIECFLDNNGGPLTVGEVGQWVQRQYPGRWKDVSTDLADLVVDGSPSTLYSAAQRCLVRVRRGVYRLAPGSSGGATQAERESTSKLGGREPGGFTVRAGDTVEVWSTDRLPLKPMELPTDSTKSMLVTAVFGSRPH